MYPLIIQKNLLQKKTSKTTFEYKILFVSIIPPHYTTSYNMFAANHQYEDSKQPPKYFIKNSYMILSWFYHFKLITFNRTSSDKKKTLIRFIILPNRRSNYTLIKAPMAHKKNSKEQFEFKFYYILASFKGATEENHEVPSCNAAIALLLLIQKLFPLLSTNVLFLKTSKILFNYSDVNFYSYYRFSNNIRKIQ